MNLGRNKYCIIIQLLLFFSFQVMKSQDLGRFYDYTNVALPTNVATHGEIDFKKPCLPFKVNEGKVWVKIDLGEKYEKGSAASGVTFDLNVNLDLELKLSSSLGPKINFELNLNNNKPESIIYLNLEQYIDFKNTSTGLTYNGKLINGAKVVINSIDYKTSNISIKGKVKASLHYEMDYGIDASDSQVVQKGHSLLNNSKVMKLSWSSNCKAPNYEVQLLRLFNGSEDFKLDERDIKTKMDWSKALSFQTYGSETNINITIGEGQGYYIWRVRPIGTFHKNGYGNSENWGSWNTSNYSEINKVYSFSKENVKNSNIEVFFFSDLDKDKNYQYSRVFTEGNKISEKITYATSLNQVKQIQRYLSSKEYKIVSQTVLDKQGRPTLSTLPVPVSGKDNKISAYKEKFVTTKESLYRSKHFDENSNYQKPSRIDITNAFKYYSNMNGDLRIPDAEGYPFSRVIFSNDGTDRVVEKSGVGSRHMIGSQKKGQGRTVRTLYGTATDKELVALFGDEAPKGENTAKIVTIDPNNTKSVAYITKDGKTIATGLTFSEDKAVLDKIETGPSVSSKVDEITNNIRTAKGFKSSKRINILKEGTEIYLSYHIDELIVEGLCSNLEIERDYRLQIQVFNADTNEIVKNYDFTIESIKRYAQEIGITGSEIIISFDTLKLDVGTYYIQKTLEPSEDIEAKMVASQENMKKLIKPFFNWISNALKEVDCKEEMQYFYNDLFFYGKVIHNETLYNDVDKNGTLEFNQVSGCDDCSGIKVNFPRKEIANSDEEDLFLDFYYKNRDKYSIDIFYYDQNNLKTIDYDLIDNIKGITPVSVRFSTPCCSFEIPVVFTPPFPVPSAEALKAYKDDLNANSRLNNSKDYYSNAATSNSKSIYPNFKFLTNSTNNFTYSQEEGAKVVDLENTEAYPLDFEGYAISMLYECKKSSKDSYTIEEAKEEIYNVMRGWHKPGLLNQMVYHMATDSHGNSGCKNTEDGSGGINNGSPVDKNLKTPKNKYHICDKPRKPVYLENAQYSAKRLAECWEAIAIELVNELCVSRLKADIDQSSYVYDNAEKQSNDVEGHFNRNVRSWIIRWLSRSKLRRKLKSQNVGASDNLKDEVKNRSNLVKKFLDCTGYAFGDVLDPRKPEGIGEEPYPKTNFPALSYDFDKNIDNGEYDKKRLLNSNEEVDDHWGYFSLNKDYDKDNYYKDRYMLKPGDIGYSKEEKQKREDYLKKYTLKSLFPRIQDPVYAYKYYTYSDEYPELEIQVCYRDPNICEDENGTKVPCCGGTIEKPKPCNYCGIGFIKCPYTKEAWSCDQRFTFYNTIKNYKGTEYQKRPIVDCNNYHESKVYYYNPDYNKDYEKGNEGQFSIRYIDDSLPLDSFSDLEYLSEGLISKYVKSINGRTGTDIIDGLRKFEMYNILGEKKEQGVSKIENDTYKLVEECDNNCDQRRGYFREKLIELFKKRCYEIGECKIYPDDNIVPVNDIEKLVDKIVEQCKKQCDITTYACTDEMCRSAKKPKTDFGTTPEEIYDVNISYIDYGVSGPILKGISNREDQKLRVYDSDTGGIQETIITPDVENRSEAKLLEKYSYKSEQPISIWDIRRSLTYAEYSRWIQAKEWEVNLDIKSKCKASDLVEKGDAIMIKGKDQALIRTIIVSPPFVQFLDDTNDDGTISKKELVGKKVIRVLFSVPSSSQEGDILVIKKAEGKIERLTITRKIKQVGIIKEYPLPKEGESLGVRAFLIEMTYEGKKIGVSKTVKSSVKRNTSKRLAPIIRCLNDNDGDGIVLTSQLNQNQIQVEFRIPNDSEVGDTLVITSSGSNNLKPKRILITQYIKYNGIELNYPVSTESEKRIFISGIIESRKGELSDKKTSFFTVEKDNFFSNKGGGNSIVHIKTDENNDGVISYFELDDYRMVDVRIKFPSIVKVGNYLTVKVGEKEYITTVIDNEMKESGLDIEYLLPEDMEGETLIFKASISEFSPKEKDAVYVENEDGKLVVQEKLECFKRRKYINRDNIKEADADTFLDRDEYIKSKNTPSTNKDKELSKSVKSPKVGIHYKHIPKK